MERAGKKAYRHMGQGQVALLSVKAMQGVDGKAGEGDLTTSAGHPPKIALVPFVQAIPPVHLLDSDGKASSARERSAEDDFQLAVQSLGTGRADADADDDDIDDDLEAELNASDSGLNEAGSDSERQSKAACAAEEEKARTGNGVKRDEDGGSGGTGKSAPPAEHPLQRAVTSFDMALGELNQLVHLVDLARAGEFMVLERVTPSDEEQARATLDQSARVPRETLSTMVNLKKRQLKGAAEQLRARAKRSRETMQVQLAFQQGVLHLRKNWRIVAPNHGKVSVPLQVGEALSVDCSFGSAGGKPVPSTAAAGTRHRHPWLFQLRCGEGGRLEAQPSNSQSLKSFEVQLVSVTSGVCHHSLRASFPGKGDEADRTVTMETLAREHPSASNGGAKPKQEVHGDDQMELLEKHISRLQHSVFWEETFETLKAEALIDGKEGWRVHQDTRCGSDLGGRRAVAVASESAGGVGSGAKRRLVGLGPREMAPSAWSAGARVVHVLDDEVMVEMDNQYLLGYRLVSGENVRNGAREGHSASGVCAAGSISAEKGRCLEARQRQSASLCQLALLYCGSLVRQQQRVQPAAGRVTRSEGDTGREVGAWIPADSAGDKEEGSTTASTWKSVGRILSHHIFRSEIVQRLANVIDSLRGIGLPLVLRWTHLEETCPTSALSLTLGHCFHFRASLGDGCRIIVSALPGLQNPADQRNVEMQSAQDLQHFMLGEVCRQIVLTFGDIAAAWTSGFQPGGPKCFRVDLVPAAIHLLPRPEAKTTRNSTSEEGHGSSCEVRVFVEEVGVRIACSSWSASWCTANGQGPVKQDQAGVLEARSVWNSELPTTVAPAGKVNVAEWDRLDGRDLFRKFSSLLAVLYPRTTSSTYGA